MLLDLFRSGSLASLAFWTRPPPQGLPLLLVVYVSDSEAAAKTREDAAIERCTTPADEDIGPLGVCRRDDDDATRRQP